MAKRKNKTCKLFPVIRERVLTAQEATQQSGWEITAFDLPKIWEHTKGAGVKVAFLDTGCDLSHPDLAENLLPGINFVKPDEQPWDDNQHGPHAIGICCALDNDVGMVGVAPECKAIPVKVLDQYGSGDLAIVAQGIRWAADNGADIISMSLGSPEPVQEVRKAIQYAAKKGIPVFVAAGNSGCTEDVFYPAAYPETIAIGSIDQTFHRSAFSCTGKNLDFMAPGTKILSTIPRGKYAVLSGTSMATPWAVGITALMLSATRKGEINKTLAPVDDYRNALREYAIDIADVNVHNKDFYEGFGIIDARKMHELFHGTQG